MSDARENSLICPKCQHENESSAQKCAKCGSSLVITVPVPPSAPDHPEQKALVVVDEQPAVAASPQPNTLTLLIAGYTEPVVVPAQPEIVLGRSAPGETQPTVDLSKYNGHVLGVSRHHAKIVQSPSGFMLHDLDSANGTWINENRVQADQPRPVKGGDQIRLGHLIAFVYFTAVDAVILTNSAGTLPLRAKLTPRTLVNTVGPLLVAVADIQQIINALQSRPQSDMTVKSLVMLADHSLEVKLEGVSEAIKLVREQVIPWKRDNVGLITQFDQAESLAQTTTLTEHERQQNEARRASLRSVGTHLSKALVERLAPDLPESEKASAIEKLVTPLETVITNELEIADRPLG